MARFSEKFYAGIGSRETPEDVLALMLLSAARLSNCGYTLRSGGAEGADDAFLAGALRGTGPKPEIYVPWSGFCKRHPVSSYQELVVTDLPAYPRLLELAAAAHPRWDACTAGARKLHARNVCQVLGASADLPVEYVVCWTKTGGAHGGTGQAIRIAERAGVKVLNLQQDDHRFWLEEFIADAERTAGM